MKKFITFCPRQTPFVIPCRPAENPRLEYVNETGFPILAALNGYTESGDEVEVLAVAEDLDTPRANADRLGNEVLTFCTAHNITLRNGKVTRIDVPVDSGIESLLKTFEAVIAHLEDDDDIYACITWSTKTNVLTQMMALRYAKWIRKNVQVSCVLNGDVVIHKDQTNQKDIKPEYRTIRDVTPLIQMDDILRLVALAGVSDPESMIRHILSDSQKSTF